LLKHTKYLFRFPRYFNSGLKVAFKNKVETKPKFLPLIFKKSSVGKHKNRKKTLDKKFFFFGIMLFEVKFTRSKL